VKNSCIREQNREKGGGSPNEGTQQKISRQRISQSEARKKKRGHNPKSKKKAKRTRAVEPLKLSNWENPSFLRILGKTLWLKI